MKRGEINLPSSVNATAANEQSGARMAIAPRMTAELNACVQKRENRIIAMGSAAYSARTRERMVHELAYAARTERENGDVMRSKVGERRADAK